MQGLRPYLHKLKISLPNETQLITLRAATTSKDRLQILNHKPIPRPHVSLISMLVLLRCSHICVEMGSCPPVNPSLQIFGFGEE